MREIILHKIRFGLSTMVSRTVIESAKIEEYDDLLSGYVVRAFKGWLYGQWMDPIIIETPTSWWQMFKRDVLHTKYRKHITEYKPSVVYPKIDLPSEEHYIHISKLEYGDKK